jgi:hypothetical protein
MQVRAGLESPNEGPERRDFRFESGDGVLRSGVLSLQQAGYISFGFQLVRKSR